jgi:hypothetical protein
MRSRPRTRLSNVKALAARWLLLLVLGVVLAGASGCATSEPENDSLRPWNAPQGWEGTMPMMGGQQYR